MSVKVNDLMTAQVMTTTPGRAVERVRELMATHKVHSIPVAGPEGEPVGIVSASDLIDGVSDSTPVGHVMTEKVYTVPQYADPSVAARIMRNHRIHHLVVTHEKKIVGMLSSFDLLELVEDHRFVPKNAPTKKRGLKEMS